MMMMFLPKVEERALKKVRRKIKNKVITIIIFMVSSFLEF